MKQTLRCLTLAMAIAPFAAHADAPLDEVVVEGNNYLSNNQLASSKTGTPLIDVPQSLSVFTAEDIANRNITSISQIVDYTPGVNISQGEGHRDAVVFRGIRSTADFYVDGARDDVQYYRALYNLEQVEILRGPNALLFGRGGTGGIINRVTKKATIGESFNGYTVGGNSFGGYRASIDSNIDTGEASALRVNAMYEHLENHRDFFDGDRIGVNPTARFQLSPATTVDISYEYIDHERFVDRGIPTGANGRPVDGLNTVVFADPENNFTEIDAHVFRASVAHEFSEKSKADFTVQYGDYDKVYSNFYASNYDPATNIVELDGYIDSTDRQNTIASTNFINQFQTGGVEHKLLIGGEYIVTSSDQDRFNALFNNGTDRETFFATRPLDFGNLRGVDSDTNAITVSLSDPAALNDDTRVDLDVYSFFLQDEIALSDQLDLILGARFDSFEIDVWDVRNSTNLSNRDEEISPRAGLIVKPAENISLYYSYSESFLPRSGEQFPDISSAEDRLEPNTYENSEFGAKIDFDNGLSLTMAYFENEESSPQEEDFDPSTLAVVDTEVTGFEVQLTGNVTDIWSINANYSRLDGDEVDENGPTGAKVRELPENSFSIWNDVQLTSGFGVGLGATYQDASFIDSGNDEVLPSYLRVDAAAYYDISSGTRIQLNLENINDTTYYPSSHAAHQVTVGAPFNASLSLIGKF